MTKQRTLPRARLGRSQLSALAKRLIPDLPPWLDPPTTDKHWMMLRACLGRGAG